MKTALERIFCPAPHLILIGLLVLALLNGCNDERADHDWFYAAGKHALEQGESDQAIANFQKALTYTPHDSLSHFGIALAELQDVFRLLYVAMQFDNARLPDLSEEQHEKFLSGVAMLAQIPLNALLDAASNSVLSNHLDSLIAHIRAIGEDSDITLRLEHYPIHFFKDRRMITYDLGGEFDYGEVAFVGGIGYALLGVIDFSLAYNINVDWSPFLAIDFQEENPKILIMHITTTLLELIWNNPKFLMLNGQEGLQKRALAQLELEAAMELWFRAINFVEGEKDGQADDILAYIDSNGNDAYDPNEPFRIYQTAPFPLTGINEVLHSIYQDISQPSEDVSFDVSTLASLFNDFAPSRISLTLPAKCLMVDISKFFTPTPPDFLRSQTETALRFIVQAIPAYLGLVDDAMATKINAILRDDSLPFSCYNAALVFDDVATTAAADNGAGLILMTQFTILSIELSQLICQPNGPLDCIAPLLSPLIELIKSYQNAQNELISEKLLQLLNEIQKIINDGGEDAKIVRQAIAFSVDQIKLLLIDLVGCDFADIAYICEYMEDTCEEQQNAGMPISCLFIKFVCGYTDILLSGIEITCDTPGYWVEHPAEIALFFQFLADFFIQTQSVLLNFGGLPDFDDRDIKEIQEIGQTFWQNYDEIFQTHGVSLFLLTQAVWSEIDALLEYYLDPDLRLPLEKSAHLQKIYYPNIYDKLIAGISCLIEGTKITPRSGGEDAATTDQ
jgi:hypothetical protein